MNIILPLGISFFTFTQIAFLIDAYNNKTIKSNFINYGLFVSFFPHLLAGPIIHHADLIPQFIDKSKKIFSYKNLVLGLVLFTIGLFKKTCIADTLADWVNNGYSRLEYLHLAEAWFLSISYSLQLYFDFSGYTDMAIGSALMLNIYLPENFNSPYKAVNIQDFWRRWHITLSNWLRNYLYIPLGGNRFGEYRTYLNLMITFLIGGLWHGAGWTFVVWGGLHGIAITTHRIWQKLNIKLPTIISWFITLMFINITWIFFRSDSLSQASLLLNKMTTLTFDFDVFGSIKLFINHNFSPHNLTTDTRNFLYLFPLFLLLSLLGKNSSELKLAYQPTLSAAFKISFLLAIAILGIIKISTFIYFQF